MIDERRHAHSVPALKQPQSDMNDERYSAHSVVDYKLSKTTGMTDERQRAHSAAARTLLKAPGAADEHPRARSAAYTTTPTRLRLSLAHHVLSVLSRIMSYLQVPVCLTSRLASPPW